MFEREFRDFCFNNSIETYYDYMGKLIVTASGYNVIKNKVNIFDGSKGGLVLGKAHSEGGIHLLQRNKNNSYKYVGEMEGNEYLSPPNLPESVFKILEDINREELGNNSVIPDYINLIDLREHTMQIILLAETTQFIVNKKSSMNNLTKIMKVIKN